MKTLAAGLTSLALLAAVGHGQATYVIGGPDASMAPGSSSYSWDGTQLAALRAALEDPANFGPGGAVPVRVQTRDMTSSGFSNTLHLDCIVVPWWSDSDTSDSDVRAILQFFYTGGDLILLQDDTAHDKIGNTLGVPTTDNAIVGPSHGFAPLYDGPFGQVNSVNQSGNRGSISFFDLINQSGQPISVNANNQFNAAFWNRGEFADGAGSLLVITDVDMIADTVANYSPLNDNGRFALNAFALSAMREKVYVLGGPAASLTPNSGSWSWDGGSRIAPFRNALENPANFGTDGLVPTRFLLEEFDTVNLFDLLMLDGIVSSWWSDADLADADADTIQSAGILGCDLVLWQDDATHDRIGAKLGVPTFSSDGSASNGSKPLFSGPFGNAINVAQSGTTGRLSSFDVTAINGRPIAINNAGQVTSAIWNRSAIGPLYGKVWVCGDVDMIANTNANYSPPNDNGKFALNGAAFLTGKDEYVIAGPAASLMPSSGSYAWNGPRLADFRSALDNDAYFGADSAVDMPVRTFDLNPITPDRLTFADCFISPWWADADLSTDDAIDIMNFFFKGGDLILLQDDDLHDEIGARLGLPTFAGTAGVANGSAPLHAGPFGSANNVDRAGNVGKLDPAAVASHNGHVGSVNSSGEVVAAWWRPGEFRVGAGSLIIITDVDMIADTRAEYFPLPDDNGTFALNSVAFAVQSACSGSTVNFGSGCAGSGGIHPTLRNYGCPSLGDYNGVLIGNALGGATAFQIVGLGRGSLTVKGCPFLVAQPRIILTFPLSGVPGQPGNGNRVLTARLPDDPVLVGLTITEQILIVDPGAAQGVAATDGLEITFGE